MLIVLSWWKQSPLLQYFLFLNFSWFWVDIKASFLYYRKHMLKPSRTMDFWKTRCSFASVLIGLSMKVNLLFYGIIWRPRIIVYLQIIIFKLSAILQVKLHKCILWSLLIRTNFFCHSCVMVLIGMCFKTYIFFSKDQPLWHTQISVRACKTGFTCWDGDHKAARVEIIMCLLILRSTLL